MALSTQVDRVDFAASSFYELYCIFEFQRQKCPWFSDIKLSGMTMFCNQPPIKNPL